jgi:hypothetical protein
MAVQDIIDLEFFYSYGYQGRTMMAVRAPFATTGDGAGLIGRIVRIGGVCFEARSIGRQISGPIAVGEPIGVEVRPIGEAPAT